MGTGDGTWHSARLTLGNPGAVDLAVGELAADCTAMLSGRYAEHLLLRGRPVPVWAWTNLLAHGTEADLRRPLSGICLHPSAGVERYARAREYVAAEVLDAADRVGSISMVQAAALIPLEFALAEAPVVASWTPARWTAQVLIALAVTR